jgi:hypothetical protein
VASRWRMFPPRRHEKRFFDNPHGDNLYSRAGFVKSECVDLILPFFIEKLSHRNPHECNFTLLPAASKETP